jgi:hypothetical protein
MKVRQAGTFSIEAVNIGSLEIRMAVATDVPVTLVISQDENDVGRPLSLFMP